MFHIYKSVSVPVLPGVFAPIVFCWGIIWRRRMCFKRGAYRTTRRVSLAKVTMTGTEASTEPVFFTSTDTVIVTFASAVPLTSAGLRTRAVSFQNTSGVKNGAKDFPSK